MRFKWQQQKKKEKEIQIFISAVTQSYIIGNNRKKHVRKTSLRLPSQTVGKWNIIQNKTKSYSLFHLIFFKCTYSIIVSVWDKD